MRGLGATCAGLGLHESDLEKIRHDHFENLRLVAKVESTPDHVQVQINKYLGTRSEEFRRLERLRKMASTLQHRFH